MVRVIYLEMVYIGHYVEKSEKRDVTMLVLKKITEAKIDPQTSELETINDNFEILPVGINKYMQATRKGSTSF